jgi:hypothetical protein
VTQLLSQQAAEIETLKDQVRALISGHVPEYEEDSDESLTSGDDTDDEGHQMILSNPMWDPADRVYRAHNAPLKWWKVDAKMHPVLLNFCGMRCVVKSALNTQTIDYPLQGERFGSRR